MPERRRAGLWITAALGLAVAGAVGFGLFVKGPRVNATRAALVIDEKATFEVLVQALVESDARALDVLAKRVSPEGDARPPALTDAEGVRWLGALTALRSGFPKFGAHARATALAVTARMLDRFAIDTAPQNWFQVLSPARDVFLSGLSDSNPDVRAAALFEVGRVWPWLPGRTASAAEEAGLAEWKESFYATVVRRLGDPEPKSRAAAVACLGSMPLVDAAAVAIPYLEDKNGDVRKQVLVSFAKRPALLTEDALARHFYDSEPGIPELVELVLKTRGLTQDQVGLARLINHPKPGMRVSVIPLLKNRSDIDPVVWLIMLSNDPEESVRISAIEALATRDVPEAQNRLAEMAKSDRSLAVRQAAGRFVATASLPPLPGSSSLNPKAN